MYKVQIDRAETLTFNVSLIPVIAIKHSVAPEDLLVAIQDLILETRAREIYETSNPYIGITDRDTSRDD